MKKTKHRLIIELISLGILGFGIWYERSVLLDSWQVIQNSNGSYVLICFLLVWLNFLWSGVGYKLLAPKIKLWQVSMAHLAAGGPGRVIPGGAGHMSFGVLFLKKHGYKLEQSVAIALINNISGFVVNILILATILAFRPDLFANIHISTGRFIALCVLLLTAVTAIVLYGRYKGKKNIVLRSKKSLYTLVKSRLTKPPVTLGLIMTMLATITTNTAVLYVAGMATGLDISILQSVLVTSMGVAAGSLLPTPGGIGGVEAGLIAALTVLGFDVTIATATALLYRTATYVQPLVPGCIAYVYLRRLRQL